jgi:molecular chaperone DnaJ
MKDYYKILGVEENASDEEIKKQYRILSRKYHPDVNPQGEEQFKEIAEAYENIGTPQKRAEYNNKKNNPFQGGNFDNIFNNIFGRNPFGQRQQRKSAPDKVLKVQVNPLESYLGSEKSIIYMRNNPCVNCNGSGGERQTCASCNGAGQKVKTFGTGFMVQQILTACETCGGRGFTLVHKCFYCDGRGVKSESNDIKINLPHGVDDGQFLKLENLGDFNSGQFGDLVLQIQITPNEFEKLNNDLIYNLSLNYESLCNDNYIVPHPDGELKISAPKIFDSSKPLRIRGKGFNGGDFYVKLHVKFERDSINK